MMWRTWGLVLVFAGCGTSVGSIEEATEETSSTAGLTWEQFRNERVFEEPESGVFIADGDTPFANEKQLREFYELHVRWGQLTVNRIGSADDVWSYSKKKNLTYCISDTFGANKAAVVQAMASATGAWESVADVDFVYSSAQDAACTASNGNVIFDVRPVNAQGQYLARAFFPSNARSQRNVLIDSSALTGSSAQLVGVLRHELGHTLGFRHEHTRPEAGTCFEDNAWRAVTAYDSSSVMHYPQCNGTNSFNNLVLTALDAQGAAALYGSPTPGNATGGTPTGGGTGSAPGTPSTERFEGTVAASASKAFGPFAVTPGTTFTASLSGTGDGDLYVRFGAAPTASTYACRPYLEGSDERCELTVPSGQTAAYVTVVGFSASTFQLAVSFTKPGTGSSSGTGTPKVTTLGGSVTKGQLALSAALTVVPGTAVSVVMSGTGDPDLYVRFGNAPTLTSFDCRPYLEGASEQCSLTVPAGVTQLFLGVHGYTAATYTLQVSSIAP